VELTLEICQTVVKELRKEAQDVEQQIAASQR
jgi:hypothetical protein